MVLMSDSFCKFLHYLHLHGELYRNLITLEFFADNRQELNQSHVILLLWWILLYSTNITTMLIMTLKSFHFDILSLTVMVLMSEVFCKSLYYLHFHGELIRKLITLEIDTDNCAVQNLPHFPDKYYHTVPTLLLG